MEYCVKLHENKKLFKEAVRATAEQKGILDIYVEKDYWVTYALFTLFNNEIGKETIFKGGTALSKCFGLIDRFSEDIDLVVRRADSETDNQLKRKIKKISTTVSDILPEVEVPEVTRKFGMSRKTAHKYTKEFSGNYGQIRDVIILEATWLGYFEPYTTKEVNSYIFEMMKNTDQVNLAKENEILPFKVQVLEPERTLCEKIMSLVRFSYTETAIDDLKQKVRHTYDLYQLLKNDGLSNFLESTEFGTMLIEVASDDVESFKNNNAWLQHHPNEAKIFAELETVWAELKPVYTGEFQHLVFGNLPSESEIFETLKSIKRRLESVRWTISIENPK